MSTCLWLQELLVRDRRGRELDSFIITENSNQEDKSSPSLISPDPSLAFGTHDIDFRDPYANTEGINPRGS